jgi:hypothetical protein
VNDIPNDNKDVTRNNLIYDLCGYIFLTRGQLITCKECKESVVCEEVDLPDEFTAKQYTAFRNRGGLFLLLSQSFNQYGKWKRLFRLNLKMAGII